MKPICAVGPVAMRAIDLAVDVAGVYKQNRISAVRNTLTLALSLGERG